MSNTIKFASGTTYDTITVRGGQSYIQGASRQTLEIQFEKSAVDFSTLEALTSDSANLGAITLKDDNGEHVHNHYSIRAGIGMKQETVSAGDADTPPTTEERIYLILAQLTYSEVQSAQYAEQIADLQAAVAAAEFGGVTV